ncbi:MAG: LysM peptidoglycan-binding domain-containing protein [Acidimicrobiia bacterium]|nr:LysM peptidoglycan-binding domain-containing protein [Acidimicrobiia bacterium]
MLQVGWVLTLPGVAAPAGSAATEVVIAPGDTLWDLAETPLGDGHRYPEIVAANDTVVDPSRIQPGWVLALPGDDAVAPDTATGSEVPGETTPPALTPMADAAGDESHAGPVTVDPPPVLELADPDPRAAEPVEPSPESVRPEVVDDAEDITEPSPAEVDSRDDLASTAPVGLLGGGVATAGLVVLLDRRRRA